MCFIQPLSMNCGLEAVIDVGADRTDDQVRRGDLKLVSTSFTLGRDRPEATPNTKPVAAVAQEFLEFLQTGVITRFTDQRAVDVGDDHLAGHLQALVEFWVLGQVFPAVAFRVLQRVLDQLDVLLHMRVPAVTFAHFLHAAVRSLLPELLVGQDLLQRGLDGRRDRRVPPGCRFRSCARSPAGRHGRWRPPDSRRRWPRAASGQTVRSARCSTNTPRLVAHRR